MPALQPHAHTIAAGTADSTSRRESVTVNAFADASSDSNHMQLWLVARGWRGHGAGEPAHAVLRLVLCCFSRGGAIVQVRTISPRANQPQLHWHARPLRKAEHRGLSNGCSIYPLRALHTSLLTAPVTMLSAMILQTVRRDSHQHSAQQAHTGQLTQLARTCTGMPDPFRKAEQYHGLASAMAAVSTLCLPSALCLHTSANRPRHHALGHELPPRR